MRSAGNKSYTSWGTILLVDDVATSRELTRIALESNGFYECIEASGGREALEILDRSEIDLVLLDLLMPDMSGFDVLKEIRRRYTDTQLPVIVVTALEDTIDVVTALELGASDYVVKPFEFPVLHARVRAPLARRNAEQKLFAAMKKAEAADEAKSHMFSRMSHELRTPLNAIIGFTELILECGVENLDTQQDEYLRHVRNAGRDLLTLVNDIMTLSAIETNELILTIRRFDPAPLIDGALEPLQSLAQSKNVSVTVAGDLAAMPTIMADQARFKQVLICLLSNAIKFNRPDGRVTISFEELPSGRLRFVVEDTGYGIAEEHWNDVYEPLSNIQVEDGVQPGTGMGLTIARELILRMDGAIDFNSRRGVGSRFWFDLPISREAPEEYRSNLADGESETLPSESISD